MLIHRTDRLTGKSVNMIRSLICIGIIMHGSLASDLDAYTVCTFFIDHWNNAVSCLTLAAGNGKVD